MCSKPLESCLFVTLWTVARQAPLCPWDFPGKNAGVGCHFLFQEIFLTQGSNLHLLNWQINSLPLCHLGSPKKRWVKAKPTVRECSRYMPKKELCLLVYHISVRSMFCLLSSEELRGAEGKGVWTGCYTLPRLTEQLHLRPGCPLAALSLQEPGKIAWARSFQF